MPRTDYDVVVVGGGAAGCSAAIQAGRLGARTLLVEKNGALGGTTTVAGVALPGLFHAWGRQIIAGIGWELVTAAVELAGDDLPDFSRWDLPHYRLQVPVVAPLLAAVLDAAVLGAGVELRLHTMTAAAERSDDSWRLTLCGKEGLTEVTATEVVDCTGDADVVGLAGLARHRNDQPQPGTIMVRLAGYDLADLDVPSLETACTEAIADGRLRPQDLARTTDAVARFLRARGANAIHVTGIDGGTSATRTHAEVEARRTLVRIWRFLRTQPGLERLRIESWAIECGIRETFTVVGRHTITGTDYARGRRYDDAVSYSFYPIDVHDADGDGIDIRPLAYGTLPTIPRSAMLPRDADHLVVAGRCIAGDQDASSAYRVQASCMAMGQAAGALAALAAETGQPPAEVELLTLYAALRRHGAILPGDVRVDDVPTRRPTHAVG